MESCSICFFKGKSLRKHFAKKPECLIAWKQQEQRRITCNAITNQSCQRRGKNSDSSINSSAIVNQSYEDSENSDLSIVWSDEGSDDDEINSNDELEEDNVNEEINLNSPVSSHNAGGPTTIDIQDIGQLGFTVNQYCETKLLKILNDKQVPHGLYKDVLEWSRDAKRMKYEYEPTRLKRSTAIRYLIKWQEKQNRCPLQNMITLPGEPQLPMMVTYYDFWSELMSLLDSPVFKSIDNLDMNRNDPFSKYESPSGRINCFNAGKWYSDSYSKMCPNTKDFLLPIIFSFDESVLSNQKASIAPLKFTTSLLNQRERNKESNWRKLCFIPDLSAFQGYAAHKAQNGQVKAMCLHSMFRAGMESYVALEKDSSLTKDFSMTIAGMTKSVNVKLCCCLILGDIQGGDKICCRSASYKSSIQRICRKCNIPGDECHNLNYTCKRISMRKIKWLVKREDRERLKKYNQYCVKSIWYELNYGGCKFGVFSAANPTERLHALDNGLIMYCLHELYSKLLTSDDLIELDKVVMGLTNLPRQKLMSANSNSCFPRLLWKNSITGLKEITADYKVGMMLTVTVVYLTKGGKSMFENALGKDKAKHLHVTFQKLLAYRSWLHKTEYWEVGNNAGKVNAKEAIKSCLRYLKKHLPRTEGQGWNIPKFHEQIHVPDDIERNGPPSVTFTGVVEKQHINSKKHCERTTKNRQTLDKQTGHRLFETAVINETFNMMEKTLLSCKNKEVVSSTQKHKRGKSVTFHCKCVIQSNDLVEYTPNVDNVLKQNSNNVL